MPLINAEITGGLPSSRNIRHQTSFTSSVRSAMEKVSSCTKLFPSILCQAYGATRIIQLANFMWIEPDIKRQNYLVIKYMDLIFCILKLTAWSINLLTLWLCVVLIRWQEDVRLVTFFYPATLLLSFFSFSTKICSLMSSFPRASSLQSHQPLSPLRPRHQLQIQIDGGGPRMVS